jgi:hypothetical protein
MFNTLEVFSLDGSVVPDRESSGVGVFKEDISVAKPVVAHEVAHYISWPDLERLERDLEDASLNVNHLPKPWWFDEVKRLEQAKGFVGERKWQALKASRRFVSVCMKEAFERIRMSPILQGFMMLQFADTNRYENSNGLVDCFDNPKFISSEDFSKVNSDCVVLIDIPSRCFVTGTEQCFDMWLSNFSRQDEFARGDLHITISKDGSVLQEYRYANLSLQRKGLYRLGQFAVTLPDLSEPARLCLNILLTTDGPRRIENSYDIWCFPPIDRAGSGLPSDVPEVHADIVVSHYMDDSLLERLVEGSKVLWLYNPTNHPCPDGSYHMPIVKDHWKPVIWDRGHQMGGIVRDSAALGDFPHDGCLDFQFARLVEGAVKVNLDRLSSNIEPIIEGIDRPVRDRVMVTSGKVTGFDPEYYMRKLGYVFELNIGLGTLLVCTFNLNESTPESRYLYNAMIEHLHKAKADSGQAVTPLEFRCFTDKAPKGGLIRETPQNEYWQRDDEPVESTLFWEELGVDITKL